MLIKKQYKLFVYQINSYESYKNIIFISEIQIEILLAIDEIKNEIVNNPNEPILKYYEMKEIELTKKYGKNVLKDHWPNFQSIDAGLYCAKKNLLPSMPSDVNNLVIPTQYTLTETNERFLILHKVSPQSMLLFSSPTQLKTLAESRTWNCDGTFKTAPKLFYQNYIIHGNYNNGGEVPCAFACLQGMDIFN